MAKRKKKKRRELVNARKRAETRSSGFERTTTRTPEGMGYFQLKAAGMKRIDILPYVVKETNRFADAGQLHYEKTFYIHRIGPNGDSHVCRKDTVNEKCPICEYRSKLERDPNADEELVKSLRPKERQLFYVIDHDEPEKGVQLWDISYYLFGQHLDNRIRNSEEDDGFEAFFDPEEGMTLRLGIGEKSFAGRSYYEVQTVDFKPRREPIDPELYEDLPSLDEMIKVEGYDKLKSIFLQTTDEEEGEEEEETVEASDEEEDWEEDTKSEPEEEDDDDDDDQDDDDWDDD
tara:strand:+ start:4345 stop:5211 length:867 start_codon:yes stop_codon:yes gene_type:complete